MGWKGAVRSINAELKRAEKRQRQAEKYQQIERAHNIAEDMDEYLERIRSFHKDFCEKIDWQKYTTAAEPTAPVRDSTNELIATNYYNSYKPNFFIKLLNLVNWRKHQLRKKIDQANTLDQMTFDVATVEYRSRHNKWAQEKKFAERILLEELGAYQELFERENTFKNVSGLCTTISMQFSNKVLDVEIDVHGLEVIPKSSVKVLKSGKLSEKEFPKAQFNQIYQDYVCSAVLRVAKDLLMLFPLPQIVITAMSDQLDTSTGHIKRQPVVSAFIPRETIERMEMTRIDPSDAMTNFNHNMNFKNTTGFLPTDKFVKKNGAA